MMPSHENSLDFFDFDMPSKPSDNKKSDSNDSEFSGELISVLSPDYFHNSPNDFIIFYFQIYNFKLNISMVIVQMKMKKNFQKV